MLSFGFFFAFCFSPIFFCFLICITMFSFIVGCVRPVRVNVSVRTYGIGSFVQHHIRSICAIDFDLEWISWNAFSRLPFTLAFVRDVTFDRLANCSENSLIFTSSSAAKTNAARKASASHKRHLTQKRLA